LFRHVVMFWWKSEASDDQIDEVTKGLASLPGKIPEIQRYEHGSDLGAGGENADYVLVADFRDVEQWRTYASHSEHVKVIESSIRPIAERIERIQYELS
jgi:stress responsive alpha/beta barrel protein